MPFTLPRDAPVSLVESSTGRPVARSILFAQFTSTNGSATSTSPVARSSVYAKPFLLNCTSALRVCPLIIEIGEDQLGVGVVVPVVVRRELVRPHQRAVAGAAREHARGPLVVAGALLGVVGRRDCRLHSRRGPARRRTRSSPRPAPRPASRCRRPSVAGAELGAFVVERLEGARASPAPQLSGPDVSRGPHDLAGVEVEALQPAVDPELAARRTDDARGSSPRSGAIGVVSPAARSATLRLPHFPAGLRVDRHRVPVEQVVDDLARRRRTRRG